MKGCVISHWLHTVDDFIIVSVGECRSYLWGYLHKPSFLIRSLNTLIKSIKTHLGRASLKRFLILMITIFVFRLKNDYYSTRWTRHTQSHTQKIKLQNTLNTQHINHTCNKFIFISSGKGHCTEVPPHHCEWRQAGLWSQRTKVMSYVHVYSHAIENAHICFSLLSLISVETIKLNVSSISLEMSHADANMVLHYIYLLFIRIFLSFRNEWTVNFTWPSQPFTKASCPSVFGAAL